ncbi:MAG: nucleotide exchange factor GrpE [Actinomycetota bacterium]|nr:nucleotide exchange factor GrpE [Actinomycetota bacterium]
MTSADQEADHQAERPDEDVVPEELQDTAAPGQDGPEPVSDELAETQLALAERTSDLKRLQAEYVNYKRRVDRDRELVRENAVYSALTSLLPVLDDIDRARQHGEVEGGFKAVADALDRTVAGMGLVRFGEPGNEFDPTLHEALMHALSPDVTTTTCQHIVSAGYRIGARVVRPARVTVVDPEPAASSLDTDDESAGTGEDEGVGTGENAASNE